MLMIIGASALLQAPPFSLFSLISLYSIQHSIQSFCSTQPLIVNTQSSIALCSLLKTLSLIVLFNTASDREDTVFDRSVLSIQR
ncbi:hypothetical protein CUMW_223560 [Citrus unshiu]|uniref:Uncharacterized protein n=1 Tax=Citrus unshiu TaxID=55188 RepID=A0A2H5QF06_CITUN|nr:hypothetical protein CUMW_223560 [Citrus unshiu]